MMMTANITTLLILLLWFALVAASEHDTTRQLLHRRLGRDKGDEDKQQPELISSTTTTTPAPSLRPSTSDPTLGAPPLPSESPSILATTRQPSPAPFEYLLDTATPPSIAPKPAPTPTTSSASASVLPPALFHDEPQQTATTTPPPSATESLPTTVTLSLDEKQLLLLVLNTWVDPSVLQVALRLFDASQQAEIVTTRSVSDGVAYELSVVDWTWVVDCTTTTGGGALNAYLGESFHAVSMVRIERLSFAASSASNPEKMLEDNDLDEVSDQQMIILIFALSAAVLCCCTGCVLILVPAYCKHRRELVEEWSYDREKERALRATATMEEEEESGPQSIK